MSAIGRGQNWSKLPTDSTNKLPTWGEGVLKIQKNCRCHLLMVLYYISYLVENGGKECYHECNLKQGKCNWCGPEGWCCRLNWVGNGCDGNIGGLSNHQCVLKPTGMFF